MVSIRENWRVAGLVVLLLVSTLALFAPGATLGPAATGPTNLSYGLELSGGARVRAPMVGVTAEGVDVTQSNQAELETTVAEQLGENVTELDVQARPSTGTIEVFAEIKPDRLGTALEEAGIAYEQVRGGVTEQTRQTAVRVLRRKIDESGLAGGTVQEVTASTPGGDTEHFIVVEVPNRNRSDVIDLVNSRGVVAIVARFPAQQNGTTVVRNETILVQRQIATVGPVQEPTRGINAPHVPITLTEQGAKDFARAMQRYGFTSPQGTDACRQSLPPTQRYCIDTVLDDQVVYSASLAGGLAQGIESGSFVEQRNFVMTATNQSQARALQINMRAGALPAPLDIDDRGTSYFLAPTLASEFKLFSLITGLMAVLAVATVVSLRYGNPEVAAPMVVTALSEVYILLGFAAVVGLALDLSHIAGLIAVIGTGVDDLIIIADEVMAEGGIASGRVFRNRFRKAFWIIGAAAITTLIAMSPLAILSLGDLRGFAIITILGVLIGVLITRPAYGDILRNLLTEH
ncbi:MAG: preprotein translocase subunit SecD [Halobacteriales archaeon]|nr:preprotein translocase subunit SecD [Halobacteriales archaeon]